MRLAASLPHKLRNVLGAHFYGSAIKREFRLCRSAWMRRRASGSGVSMYWRPTILKGATICLTRGMGGDVRPLATAEARQGRPQSGHEERRGYSSPSMASLSRPSVAQ